MGAVKQAVIEMVLLGLLSTGLAFGVNAMRSEGHIKPTRNYFDKTVPVAPDGGTQEQNSVGVVSAKSLSSNSSPAPVAPTPKHLDHPYQKINLDGVIEILDDPATAGGLNVFVDARKEDDFAEGHIPGAVSCFPYEIEKCIDRVLERTNGADKVIVYCGGGDCEDSIFMCRELVEAGVPFEAIHLYAGGWKEWAAHHEPTETATDE